MGLDASVYCDCFERGKLHTQPKHEWNVCVDEYGGRTANPTNEDDIFSFDDWDINACEHEFGKLLHHRIGNIALVGLLREELSKASEQFPIILSRVIWSGTHCGDKIEVALLPALRCEIDSLSNFQPTEPTSNLYIQQFKTQISELIDAALKVKKPIVF